MSNLLSDALRRAANGWGHAMDQAQLLNGAAAEIDRLEAEAARGRGLAREYMVAYGFDDEEIERAFCPQNRTSGDQK